MQISSSPNTGVVQALNAQLHEVARQHTPAPPLRQPTNPVHVASNNNAASVNLQGQHVGTVLNVKA